MLITDEYRRLNAELHDIDPEYGVKGQEQVPFVMELFSAFDATTILDYGCGKGTLKMSLMASGFPEVAARMQEHDPAIPSKDHTPDPADIVVCSDVLEHVEPACLDEVLDDLQRLTRLATFVLVSTIPAEKELTDGRNTHLIIEPSQWWMPKLQLRFDLMRFDAGERGTFRCFLTPYNGSS
jgi:2-polyprenyl-3-methyl-5-hydroxy-6-metoxy-1,4-benzoquinol methylase|tara:strand:+ start:4592 stop:5134 length:543 start_codon:yes stop_codon:yes gene_type:complete